MRLLDIVDGIKTLVGWDHADRRMVVAREQDVEPYLEANKTATNQHGDHRRFKGDFHRVASIPNIVIEQWLKEGINIYDKNDWPKVRAKLNDRENLHLRTMPGRL